MATIRSLLNKDGDVDDNDQPLCGQLALVVLMILFY